jgi:hypothetical protein
MPTDFSQFGPFLFAALVVFAVYRRLRRSFGRQPMRPRRMVLRMALLTVLVCTLLPTALRSAQYLAAELIGAMLGLALGVWGERRTRFQMYNRQLHYLPHTYTGLAVSLLFLGRLVYRLVQVYAGGHAAHAASRSDPSQGFAPASMISSPLTVCVFFVLAGYYLYFYGMLLWKSKHLKSDDIEVASAAT